MSTYTNTGTDPKYVIVFDNDEVIAHYNTLVPTQVISYNRDNIETFDDKQLWIARLAQLNITYEELTT